MHAYTTHGHNTIGSVRDTFIVHDVIACRYTCHNPSSITCWGQDRTGRGQPRQGMGPAPFPTAAACNRGQEAGGWPYQTHHPRRRRGASRRSISAPRRHASAYTSSVARPPGLAAPFSSSSRNWSACLLLCRWANLATCGGRGRKGARGREGSALAPRPPSCVCWWWCATLALAHRTSACVRKPFRSTHPRVPRAMHVPPALIPSAGKGDDGPTRHRPAPASPRT